MSINGTARIRNGKYVINGDFHHIAPSTPIRNENDDWKLVGVTNPRELIHLHSYGGEAPFFENLSQAKILGTKCENHDCETTGSIYLPFRIHCPDCLSKNRVMDLTDICREKAIVHTFMVCERSGAFNTLEKPIKFINLEFAGISTILMSYLSIGEPKTGMRVTPIFRTTDPTYTITDLSWVEKGTPSNVLPEGFSFN